MYRSIDSFIRRNSLLLLSLFGLFTTNAQNLEQVHLKDGSVIEGYICEQIPGKTLIVQGNKATLIVGADSLISSIETTIPISDLSSEWKSWAMEQTATPEAIKLSTLKFPNSEYKDVMIVENGRTIKLLSLTPKQYPIGWSDLEKTSKILRPAVQFSGLNDILIMKDGSRHIGQVSEQVPGKSIKIEVSKDNTVTVNASQVVEMQSVPASDQFSIFEQAPMLDRIYVRGVDEPVDGVITKRKTSNDLTILTNQDEALTYAIKDILKYQKIPNPNYQVLTDKELKPGEIILNGSSKNAWFTSLQTLNGYLVLGEDVSMVAKKGEEIILEANLENASSAINLIKAYRKDISTAGPNYPLYRDVFTYQDLVEKALPVERTITPLGNIKVSFSLDNSGDYILSVQGQKGFIIIHVD